MAALAQELLGMTQAKTELPGRVRKLESGELGRVVLLKNNDPVAVILTTGEYERLMRLEVDREFIEDALAVLERSASDTGARISLDDLKAKYRAG